MIELKHITHGYNNEDVIKDASLCIEDGEFVSIMGASGSGKTTLVNILGGFLVPNEGQVLWDDRDIFTFNEKQKAYFRCNDMGFMFQSFRLINTLTGKENIIFPALLSHMDSQKVEAQLQKLAVDLAIDNVLDKYPTEMSGGQQQRVALARALVTSPRVVIMDEPTGALDSQMQKRVMELLCRVNKEQRATVIQITHSEEMANYGTRIIRIKDGKICG